MGPISWARMLTIEEAVAEAGKIRTRAAPPVFAPTGDVATLDVAPEWPIPDVQTLIVSTPVGEAVRARLTHRCPVSISLDFGGYVFCGLLAGHPGAWELVFRDRILLTKALRDAQGRQWGVIAAE